MQPAILHTLLGLLVTCLSASGTVLRGVSTLPALAQSNAQGNASTSCALPSFARWCNVRPASGRFFQMAVYNFNDIVSDTICNQGFWELQDPSTLGTPGTALDIGANVGYYSFLLADAGWNVESFEPLPKNLELMRATACQNPTLASKVNIHAVGLGEHDDSCVFISGHDNVGDGWVRCGAEANNIRSGVTPVPAGYAVRGSFPVKRLDDILATGPSKIDYVKLDVEGFECQVFKGATSVLKNFRPRLIQSEVWPKMDNCQPQEYLSMFKTANYKVAKTVGCEWEDSSFNGQIQDYWMCRRGTFFLQRA